MGNSQQQASEYGAMIIRTDKPFYFAGEVVTGNIYLNVSQEGFPGQVIQLKVKGKEQCSWIEEHTETVEEADETHSGKQQFYQHKIQIQAFQTPGLPVGQYIFPFQFQLHQNLPGSFYEKEKDYMGKTSYRVKAEIESQKNPQKQILLFQMVKRKLIQLLVVVQIKEPHTSNVYLIKTFIYQVKRLIYGLTQIILIVNWMQNIQITNQLLLSSDKGGTKQFTNTYTTQTIKGIQAGVKAIENDRKQIQLLLHDKKKPEGINPSSNESIIKSKHTLNVVAKLDGCTCCSIDPTLELPIQIVAPVPQIYNKPIPLPSNWNPQTLYQKDLQQPANYNYPPPPPEQNQFGQMMKPMG